MADVEYPRPDGGYLQRRGLKRHAGVCQLWALGVGAVISGDFFGWNYGLVEGGFGGLVVALGIITALFAGLCYSIAEMSPALPHAGERIRSRGRRWVLGAATSPAWLR